MLSYARVYLSITYENSLENITWSEIGKQNVQAEEINIIIREQPPKRLNAICSSF